MPSHAKRKLRVCQRLLLYMQIQLKGGNFGALLEKGARRSPKIELQRYQLCSICAEPLKQDEGLKVEIAETICSSSSTVLAKWEQTGGFTIFRIWVQAALHKKNGYLLHQLLDALSKLQPMIVARLRSDWLTPPSTEKQKAIVQKIVPAQWLVENGWIKGQPALLAAASQWQNKLLAPSGPQQLSPPPGPSSTQAAAVPASLERKRPREEPLRAISPQAFEKDV